MFSGTVTLCIGILGPYYSGSFYRLEIMSYLAPIGINSNCFFGNNRMYNCYNNTSMFMSMNNNLLYVISASLTNSYDFFFPTLKAS